MLRSLPVAQPTTPSNHPATRFAVNQIGVVGHRVVHGGAKYSKPVVIDDRVVEAIEQCIPLAPLHNPANLHGIRAARLLFPCPQVAVFDTAFHATIPAENHIYALPRELAENHGIRRYGFHGSSYTFVLERAATLLKRPPSELNLIVLHLGNGASMAAIRRGMSRPFRTGPMAQDSQGVRTRKAWARRRHARDSVCRGVR